MGRIEDIFMGPNLEAIDVTDFELKCLELKDLRQYYGIIIETLSEMIRTNTDNTAKLALLRGELLDCKAKFTRLAIRSKIAQRKESL